MTNQNLSTGSIWRLHHRDREIALLTVTGNDMPWTYATVETLPDFDQFRSLFTEQEQALDTDDWERADACYEQPRGAAVWAGLLGRRELFGVVHERP